MSSQIATAKPTVASEVIWRQLDDNAVIVSPESGEVRVLNGVGTAIWRMLIEEHSVTDIVTYLTDHYQVTTAEAERDVTIFLHELQNRDLILWQETAVSP